MKIWKLVLLIIGLLIVAYFTYSIAGFVKKFNSFSNVEMIEDNTSLRTSTFHAKNIRSSNIDSIQLKGLTVLNFWATWCKPCISEQESLENLSVSYPNIKFIQLSFDDENKQRKMIDSLQWKLPAYLLNDTIHFKTPNLLPMTLFMKDSIVIRQWLGAQDWQDTSITNFINSVQNRIIENTSR